MRKKLARPSLEQLESRWVPATVRFTGGMLLVSNPALIAGASSLTLTQTAPNTFQVKDGTAINGTYAGVSNLYVTGSNAPNTITVNLSGRTYTGSLTAMGGNANDVIGVEGNGGAIRGNVTILPGSGNDSVSMNANSTGTITVGGQIQVTDTAGNDSITFGNTSAVSQFLGTVYLSGMNQVRVGPAGATPAQTQADFYGGDFNASVPPTDVHPNTTLDAPNTIPVGLDFEQGEPAGGPFLSAATITISGSLRLTGPSADNEVLTGAMMIGKDLVVNVGTSVGSDPAVDFGNDLSPSAHQSGTTTVGGNFSYTCGGGPAVLDMAGVHIQGNTNINLGDGNDVVALDQVGPLTPTLLDGNLTITGGNGNDTIGRFPFDPSSDGIDAQIGGYVQITLGNGDNEVIFAPSSQVGGTITYRSGNGNNNFQLNGETYNVNLIFGSGNDTVTLNNAAAVLTGYLDGDGGVNTINQMAGQIGSPFTLKNF